MVGQINIDHLYTLAQQKEIDTVLMCMVDMQGRLMGKRTHVEWFLKSGYKETHGCQYLLATDMDMSTVPGYESTSWEKGYGDYIMKPDLATLRILPWLNKTALVICDILNHHTHEEVPYSPRGILKRQVKRLEEMGYESFMASELEFFLFQDSFAELASRNYQNLKPWGYFNEDYSIFLTTKEEEVMQAIRNGLYEAGINVECSKGEASSGQEEINVEYSNTLDMADTHSLIKNACKEIAWSKGRAVTFMAKWSNQESGSSAHIHQSLRKKDNPIFYDEKAEYGMSKIMQHYLSGLLKYSKEFTYFLAPYVNSYKRFAQNTFAPTSMVWSTDNRTAGYRICGLDSESIRVECRIGGADLNPYLAMAGMLAAGISGMEEQLVLPKEFTGNAYCVDKSQSIPATLGEALNELEQSSMLRKALGDKVVEHYVHCGRWEEEKQATLVTDWDIKQGFERS